MKKTLLTTLFVMSAIPAIGFAASFDCAKASSTTEKLICGDEKISALDEQLAASYKRGLGASPDKDEFKKTQLDWLRQQRACKDAACLTQAYQNRLDQLEGSPSAKPIYVLTKGQQYEVCRVFTDYLNSPYYKKGDCTIGNYPTDKRLRSLEYKQVDIKQYEDQEIADRIIGVNENEKMRLPKRIKEMNDAGERDAWIANVSIKNDGSKDNILVIKNYDSAEQAKMKYCETLGAGINKLLNGKIDNSSWGEYGLHGVPIIFDSRTFLLSSGWGGEGSYSIDEPTSTSVYRSEAHYSGEVMTVEICDIKSEKVIQY